MPISIDKWCSGGSAAGEMLVKGKLPPPACKMTDDTGGCTHTAFKLPLCPEGLRPGDRKLFLHWFKKKKTTKKKIQGQTISGTGLCYTELPMWQKAGQGMCLLPCLQKNKVTKADWTQHYLEKGTPNAAGLGW